MNATEELAFIRRVLRVFEQADAQSELYWRFDIDYPGQLSLLAMCNDLFWWATADCEEITPENIEILEQTFLDLKEIESKPTYKLPDESRPSKFRPIYPMSYISELFSARSRKMRPQQPCYKTMSPDIAVLFDACGPVRDPRTEG